MNIKAEERLNKALIDKYLHWENVKFTWNDWDGSMQLSGEITLFYDGEGKRLAACPSPWAFTQSLDACYDYLIPFLPKGIEVTIFRTGSDDPSKAWGCYIGDFREYIAECTPAKALCRTLLEFT